MSKIGESLLRGAKEALAHANGEKKLKVKIHKIIVPKQIDVRVIRLKLHLTRRQSEGRWLFNWHSSSSITRSTIISRASVLARSSALLP